MNNNYQASPIKKAQWALDTHLKQTLLPDFQNKGNPGGHLWDQWLTIYNHLDTTQQQLTQAQNQIKQLQQQLTQAQNTNKQQHEKLEYLATMIWNQ